MQPLYHPIHTQNILSVVTRLVLFNRNGRKIRNYKNMKLSLQNGLPTAASPLTQLKYSETVLMSELFRHLVFDNNAQKSDFYFQSIPLSINKKLFYHKRKNSIFKSDIGRICWPLKRHLFSTIYPTCPFRKNYLFVIISTKSYNVRKCTSLHLSIEKEIGTVNIHYKRVECSNTIYNKRKSYLLHPEV